MHLELENLRAVGLVKRAQEAVVHIAHWIAFYNMVKSRSGFNVTQMLVLLIVIVC